eukprot:jgi/Botrbrau1/21399/Bobra.0216s0018.1
MRWIYEKALARAQQYGIQGVTYQLTQGVVKNIVPAIASTNAIIAAACALEALKVVSLFSTGMNNYMMYVGTDGVYTHTVSYDKDESCIMCSAGIPVEVDVDATLQDVIEVLLEDVVLGPQIKEPSISYGSKNLYMRGVLEEMTRPNLSKKMLDLLEGEQSVVLQLNDKALPNPVRIRLKLGSQPTPSEA